MSEADIDVNFPDINTDINVEVNVKDLARTEGIVGSQSILILGSNNYPYQDPLLLLTLPDNLQATQDIAPPPSAEDIFGKVDALKSQFEIENEKIVRQLKENQVS